MNNGPLNPDVNPLYANPETIPVQYWERLKRVYSEKLISFIFLSKPTLLDLEKKTIDFQLEVKHTYQLYLVILHYLYQKKVSVVPKELLFVLPNELKGGVHFFKNSHPIDTSKVLSCFKNRQIIEKIMNLIGGKSINIGDAGYIIPVFEDIFLRYVFWEGDEEFSDNLTINIQKNLEDLFPLDVIWAMINVVNQIISSIFQKFDKVGFK